MNYSILFRHLDLDKSHPGQPKKGARGEPTHGVRGSLRSGRAPRDIGKRDEDTNPGFFGGLVPGSSAQKEDSHGVHQGDCCMR